MKTKMKTKMKKIFSLASVCSSKLLLSVTVLRSAASDAPVLGLSTDVRTGMYKPTVTVADEGTGDAQARGKEERTKVPELISQAEVAWLLGEFCINGGEGTALIAGKTEQNGPSRFATKLLSWISAADTDAIATALKMTPPHESATVEAILKAESPSVPTLAGLVGKMSERVSSALSGMGEATQICTMPDLKSFLELLVTA